MRASSEAIGALLLASLLATVPGRAQEAGTGEDREPPCSAPEHRQFDFWIGTWTVTGADGEVAGENTIGAILDGCALLEQWRGEAGGGQVTGTSYNAYDARRKRWHQTWVDRNGLLLLLDGGLDGEGRMVLSGELPGREGGTALHRITWTPVGPDEVRQKWEASRDGGASWETVFDGTYRRKG